MAKKPMRDNESVAAELAAGGAPFGYKADGTARRRPERPKVPDELRNRYVIYGINKGNGAKSIVTQEKSMRSVTKTLEKWKELLMNNYSAVEVVRSRRILFTEF